MQRVFELCKINDSFLKSSKLNTVAKAHIAVRQRFIRGILREINAKV